MTTTSSTNAAESIQEQGDPVDDTRAFRRALGQFATGVTVMTTTVSERQVGMAVNSFAAVSLDPPLVSWSIRNESRSLNAFARGEHFAVNVLADDQVETSALFSRPQENAFDNVSWNPGIHGDPILNDAIAHFECTVEATHEGGDHVIIIGRVNKFTRLSGAPLVFFAGQYRIAKEHPRVELTSAAPYSSTSGNGDASPLFVSLLKSTEQRMSRLFNEYRDQLGINIAGSRVINLLDDGITSITEIADQALLGESAVEDTLSDFKTRGWVGESPSGDLHLTVSGKSIRGQLLEAATKFSTEKLSQISDSDIQAARRVLVHLLTT